MTHPDDLLADYVDGALADAERAVVDAHLGTCARCRDELDLARGARAALNAMPLAEAPAGVASRALAEAASAGKAEGPPRWTRLLPVAAAAVVVGLLAIALPRHQQNAVAPRSTQAAEAVSGPTGPQPTAGGGDSNALEKLATKGVSLESQSLDYTDESLRSLVEDTSAQWRGAVFPERASTDFASATTGALDAAGRSAFDCVFQVVPRQRNAILVRLIEASYQGNPAFLAVVLEGTGPGRAADRAVVWIVREEGCTLARVVEIRT